MLETAVQLESDPPETVTSDSTKSVEASERVKVSVDVSPALKESSASSSVMAMVGLSLSKIEAVSLMFPTVRVALCVASGVESSVVEKVAVNELTPAGTETVLSALL